MESRELFKKLLLGISIIGISFIFTIIFNENSADAALSKQTNSFKEIITPGLPIRLKIPKIKVDAKIDSVGLTSLGAMDVPKGPSTTAWFNLGTKPGEKGSAVIDGHLDWENGSQAVFGNLNKLRKGDKLYVIDNKGNNISFIVKEIRKYDQKSDASDIFSSSDGLAHLNLITCEGVWDKKEKSYSNRLIIFSDKII